MGLHRKRSCPLKHTSAVCWCFSEVHELQMLPAPSCMTPLGHKFMLGRGRRGKFVGFGAWKVEHLFGKGKELSWLCLPRGRRSICSLQQRAEAQGRLLLLPEWIYQQDLRNEGVAAETGPWQSRKEKEQLPTPPVGLGA